MGSKQKRNSKKDRGKDSTKRDQPQAPAPQTLSGQPLAGVDIGGTKIHALITDDSGRVLARARRKTRGERGVAAVMERVHQLLHDVSHQAQVTVGELALVGVGVPSPVLPDGTAVQAPNLGWQGVPVTRSLGKLLDLPVYAINDCNAGTLGEQVFGSARKARTLVGLFVGTGLGGGILFRGELLAGENCLAAELGHMVVQRGGRRCGCGRRGCLEAYASRAGMGRRITHEIVCEGRASLLTELCGGDYGRIRSGLLGQAYEQKDPVAVETLHEAADYLGTGVGSLITLLGPDQVVLGGGVMEALGARLLPRVKKAARAATFPAASYKDTRIGLASLGDDAVALGAVAWARRQLQATKG